MTAEASTLSSMLEALGRFSAGGPGVTRLAYDEHWCEAHRWLQARARALGLECATDLAGNLYVHAPGLATGSRVLMVGSHLDTVREGGLYDGAYGAVCGVLAAADLGARAGLPVVGIVTAEEEGSRFSGDMLGARALLGSAKAAELDATKDRDGTTWRQALAYACKRGCAVDLPGALGASPDTRLRCAPFEPSGFLEVHIEQGPVLERERLAIGIVEHIVGYRRLRARVTGEARHAGTTPMDMRRDALAASAEMVLAVEAAACEMGDPAVATAGNAIVSPGLYNVVAGAAELWIEARHIEAAALEKLTQTITERCESIAQARKVKLVLERIAGLEPSRMSERMVRTAETLSHELKLPHRRMPSGAGHDAMLFAAAGVETLMIFVPSRGGISHSPDEHTDPEALWTGYTFLRELARRVAEAGVTT